MLLYNYYLEYLFTYETLCWYYTIHEIVIYYVGFSNILSHQIKSIPACPSRIFLIHVILIAFMGQRESIHRYVMIYNGYIVYQGNNN